MIEEFNVDSKAEYIA